MSIVQKKAKPFEGLSADDLDALLKACMKDLLDINVNPQDSGRLTVRKQIARILTRMNSI